VAWQQRIRRKGRTGIAYRLPPWVFFPSRPGEAAGLPPELELVVCVGPAAIVFGLDRDPRLEAGAPVAALLLKAALLLVVELLLEGVRGAAEAAAAREASDNEDGSSMSSSVESALHGFGESGVLLATACGA
jgi:hypothetical protein